MVVSPEWIPDAWHAAVEALRSQSSVDELLALHEGGAVTSLEVSGIVWRYCHDDPGLAARLVQSLRRHASKAGRDVADDIQRLLDRCKQQIKDIEHIRRTCPLRPGAELRLSGGYSQHDPWWLNGREYYKATFVRFAERGVDKMPVVFAELEDEIDMTEARGLRHKGRYALLKLTFVANWVETETVTVHIVEALPEGVEAFYSSHPIGTEIESHATYAIVNEGRAAGSGT